MRKGKAARPLTILEKNPLFVDAFAKLGEQLIISEDLVHQLEQFVCTMYNKPILESVNKARLVIFEESFAPKKDNEPLTKIKGTDPSHLPPCHEVLLQKICRTNYVSYIWKHAVIGISDIPSAENFGWLLENGSYTMKWYDGRQVPENVCIAINAHDLEEEEDDPEYDSSSDESDVDFE